MQKTVYIIEELGLELPDDEWKLSYGEYSGIVLDKKNSHAILTWDGDYNIVQKIIPEDDKFYVVKGRHGGREFVVLLNGSAIDVKTGELYDISELTFLKELDWDLESELQ